MHAELMEAREATEEAIAIITVRIDGLYHGRLKWWQAITYTWRV